MTTYLVTGKWQQRYYAREFSDYEQAVQRFTVCNLKNIWTIDINGKRKLLKKNEETK